MPLLNYTTEIAPEKSVAEITRILQEGGANAILFLYDAEKRVSAIQFKLTTTFGETAFELPANVAAVSMAINAQIKAESDAIRMRRKRSRNIPLRLHNDRAQAERIAWRIVKDWIEAQMALNHIGAAKLEQVLLPFAVDQSGKTFYQRLVDRGGPLMLQ